MKLVLSDGGEPYRNNAQYARVVTEGWAAAQMYCPNCGHPRLAKFPANRPVADFLCESCEAQYELKSQKKAFGRKIANGAFATKMKRLASDNSPHLIIMQYDVQSKMVINLETIPSRFFTTAIIERRKPLSKTARRAGWVGSNIILEKIPRSGRVQVVSDGQVVPTEQVRSEWERTRFLDETRPIARGWLVEVMAVIDKLGNEFTLDELYSYDQHFQAIYPQNRNVKPKLRQQLQFLRDRGYLSFVGRGQYCKT